MNGARELPVDRSGDDTVRVAPPSRGREGARRRRRRIRPLGIVRGFVIAALLLWTLVPILLMIDASLETQAQLTGVPFKWLPDPLTFRNYLSLLFGQYGSSNSSTATQLYFEGLRNSLIIASGTTLLSSSVGILGGYAFSRFRFRGKEPLFFATMTMQMFPFIAMLVPLFLLVRQLGLRDTWWSLILVDSAFIAPYAVWIMRNFFAAIPRDLDDAAAIDGAGRMRTLVSVVLPISAPGIAAIAIYAFLAAWNDFLAGFILTSTPNAQPLTVLMAQFSSHNMADIGLQITGGLLAALPPVVLVLVFQRYLVRGLTAGAVKG